jgi:hypothetical protein
MCDCSIMARSQRLHPQAGYTFAISTQDQKTVGNREESIYGLRTAGFVTCRLPDLRHQRRQVPRATREAFAQVGGGRDLVEQTSYPWKWMSLRIQIRYACSVRRLRWRRHTTDIVSIASKARASASCLAFSEVGAHIAVVLTHERRCQARR